MIMQNYLELKNGIASVATVSRLLSSVDEEMFCQAFIEWMAGLPDTRGIRIAIDGKSQKIEPAYLRRTRKYI